MKPSLTRSITTGVAYVLPERRPVCSITPAYQYFRPATSFMTGFSTCLLNTRTLSRTINYSLIGVRPVRREGLLTPCRAIAFAYPRAAGTSFGVDMPSEEIQDSAGEDVVAITGDHVSGAADVGELHLREAREKFVSTLLAD